MDRLSQERRSWLMSQIRGKDTLPELALRSLIHRMGFRFRLHRKDLPGKPDLVFPSKKKVIFLHGCFWHGHICKKKKMPKTRITYWNEKIDTNRSRDRRVIRQLGQSGWKALIIWECDLKKMERLKMKVTRFLIES
jgi:DNA mismatch endonuclease (patch repair protein)